MTQNELIDAYESWLSRYSWRWFITLTCRGYPSAGKANHLFHQWVDELGEAEGADDFSWVKVLEMGKAGDNAHLHVLVGGLTDWDASVRQRWIGRWDELAGNALIGYYDADRRGIAYMLKTVDLDGDLDIELDLNPKFRCRA